MAVYDSAVEAIFLCYLVDQEENGGDVHSYYASRRLRGYMEDHKPSLILPNSNPGSRADSDAVPASISSGSIAAVTLGTGVPVATTCGAGAVR